MPFENVEALGDDTGERFFSAYLEWLNTTKPAVNSQDMCLCTQCTHGIPEVTKAAATQQKQVAAPVEKSPKKGDEEVSNVVPEATDGKMVTAPLTTFRPPPALLQQQPGFLIPPTIWMNPYLVPPANYTGFCCEKYRLYCQRSDRRGRPPHANWCAFKSK